MRADFTDSRDRLRSAVLVVLIHVVLGYALVSSLGFTVVPRPSDALKLFTLADRPPPPPLVPPPPERRRTVSHKPLDAAGAAAPPALRHTPTEVAAPKPRIVLPPPPPIAAALLAGQGSAPAAGAAPIAGPGTGRGGTGNGLGSGMSGDGNGGGGFGGRGALAEQIAGNIDNEDYPAAALNAHAQGTVYFRFTVDPDGRVASCRIRRSSGDRALDDTTCRLALRRFRFRPATDRTGRPIATDVSGEQEWALGNMQELPPEDDQR